jgi:NADPH-dependent curcumin reductase CurA
MKNFGKIALCGASASYENYSKRSGLRNLVSAITKRVQLKGITFLADPQTYYLNQIFG